MGGRVQPLETQWGGQRRLYGLSYSCDRFRGLSIAFLYQFVVGFFERTSSTSREPHCLERRPHETFANRNWTDRFRWDMQSVQIAGLPISGCGLGVYRHGHCHTGGLADGFHVQHRTDTYQRRWNGERTKSSRIEGPEASLGSFFRVHVKE